MPKPSGLCFWPPAASPQPYGHARSSMTWRAARGRATDPIRLRSTRRQATAWTCWRRAAAWSPGLPTRLLGGKERSAQREVSCLLSRAGACASLILASCKMTKQILTEGVCRTSPTPGASGHTCSPNPAQDSATVRSGFQASRANHTAARHFPPTSRKTDAFLAEEKPPRSLAYRDVVRHHRTDDIMVDGNPLNAHERQILTFGN